MIHKILSRIDESVPALEWFVQLPTPAGKEEFGTLMSIVDSLREKPDERLCVWFPDAPELLMEIRHCAGGYLAKERTDFDPDREEPDEALKKVKFQFYYETSGETEEMLRSFCCGEDALVTAEKEDRTFCWKVQLTETAGRPCPACV
ncbi:MAG: hypothetical protein IJD13_03390 [Oscillospiraceae bacterium]|nr:hypothetical protein [Oscillospiraceae bacterium]